MRFSEIKYEIPQWMQSCNENSFVIRGYALRSFGVDLMNIPERMMLSCAYVPSSQHKTTKMLKKVYVRDIVGTSYQDYGGDTWMASFLKVKRMDHYILQGSVTKEEYLRQLRKKPEGSPIELTLAPQGLIIDGNGNHRVTAYMMMYLSELSAHDYDKYGRTPQERAELAMKNYWLYAMVNIPLHNSQDELCSEYGYKIANNWLKFVYPTENTIIPNNIIE